MKKNKFHLLCSLFVLFSINNYAQSGYVKRAIEKDMKKKYADPQRKKGKEEIEKVTYQNDPRYKDATNKVQATIVYENKELKKNGTIKETGTLKTVFGKNGECMIMNEGDKKEIRVIYNYADKANYFVNMKEKKAMKTPLINMQKMFDRQVKIADSKVDSNDVWKNTGEKQLINGYNCTRYTYTSAKTGNLTYEEWTSTDLKLDLGNNYVFGSRLDSYKSAAQKSYINMHKQFVVRSIFYDKNGIAIIQKDLKEFTKTADEQYFDLSQFKVHDVLDAL